LLEQWLGERRGGRVHLRVPLRGSKKQFLELVRKNALLAFEARFRSAQTHGVAALEALADALGLDEAPYLIECFDISNIQGTDSVASLVVWEGGKPRKSTYRSFGIREVQGPDDTASIAEAVTRRYRRVLAEDRRLPDLVLIDGGRGQLGAAVAALTHVGLPTLPVAAIAKREEEIFQPARPRPVRLDRASPALQLIQRIRDEAHRFALSRHRRKRARRTLRTELTDLPGIGPVKARKLLLEFGSLDGVRRADVAALSRLVGRKTAETIARHYGTSSEPE
jgi:excinuclease ABC subunit C